MEDIQNNTQNNTQNNVIFVLASVLKYAKDVRMYEKIGKSLIKKYKNANFHFVGQACATPTETTEDNAEITKNIHFHELFNFNRIAVKRFFTLFTFFFFLLKTKPNILIIGTFELLLPSVFYKIFRFIFRLKKVKLIYDVQENYVANIRYTKVFLPLLRDIIAVYVYLVEKITCFFVNFFFLAENCYEQELTFIGKTKENQQKKYEILPNFILREDLKTEEKTVKFAKRKPAILQANSTFLLSMGTVSKEYGIEKLFPFLDNFDAENNRIINLTLDIFGHTPAKSDFSTLGFLDGLMLINNIRLITKVSRKPIPYAQIKEKMRAAAQRNTFVVMPYNINKSYEKRIPTKFYECLAYNLPMIIQENKYWEDFFEQIQNLIPTHKINVTFVDFNDTETPFDYKILIKNLTQKNQNSHLIAELPIFWDICEERLNKINF